jgi:hypothetical protein
VVGAQWLPRSARSVRQPTGHRRAIPPAPLSVDSPRAETGTRSMGPDAPAVLEVPCLSSRDTSHPC